MRCMRVRAPRAMRPRRAGRRRSRVPLRTRRTGFGARQRCIDPLRAIAQGGRRLAPEALAEVRLHPVAKVRGPGNDAFQALAAAATAATVVVDLAHDPFDVVRRGLELDKVSPEATVDATDHRAHLAAGNLVVRPDDEPRTPGL